MKIYVADGLSAADYFRAVYPDLPPWWDVYSFEELTCGSVEFEGAVPRLISGKISFSEKKHNRIFVLSRSDLENIKLPQGDSLQLELALG
ncbi:MAG: hypothetical protein ACRC62_08505 [Microcoleus sp.]